MYHVVCPKCGHESPANTGKCPQCATNLMGVPWKEPLPAQRETVAAAAVNQASSAGVGSVNMAACPHCGVSNPVGAATCGNCSKILPAASARPSAGPVSYQSDLTSSRSSSSYSSLRTIAGLFTILAWVTAILSALSALLALALSTQLEDSLLVGLIGAGFMAVGGVVSFVTLLAIGESILVMLDIEANTRLAAAQADRMARALERQTP